MDEIDKRIHLSFFVLFFMNLFYALISNSYLYLVYFIFALIVAYFVAYPDKFFLLLKDAESFAKKFVSPNKRNINNSTNMVESYERIDIPNEVENNRIEDKGQEKERNSQENTENIRKGGNTAYYY
jgi:hypothetical protein